jgi:hypothetical protein
MNTETFIRFAQHFNTTLEEMEAIHEAGFQLVRTVIPQRPIGLTGSFNYQSSSEHMSICVERNAPSLTNTNHGTVNLDVTQQVLNLTVSLRKLEPTVEKLNPGNDPGRNK